MNRPCILCFTKMRLANPAYSFICPLKMTLASLNFCQIKNTLYQYIHSTNNLLDYGLDSTQ